MHSQEKRRRFIQLRGQGLSYRKIAKELKISTNTLVRWSLILDVHINNAKIIEFEGLMEEYLATRCHRIEALGTQHSVKQHHAGIGRMRFHQRIAHPPDRDADPR